MSETLSPSVGEDFKPFEIMKSLSQEKAQLQKEVVAHQPLIKRFTDYMTKSYSAEELEDVTEGTDINTYISSQILGLKIEDSIDHVGSLLPGAKDLLSVYKEGKKMFDEVNTMFGGSGPKSLIDEYIALRKTKPFELKKIEQWMASHDGTNDIKEEKNETDNSSARSADDEEDFEDNKEYKLDFKNNSRLSDNMEKYISLLPVFTSVGYQKDPHTGTTLCSRTAAEDAKKLYGLDWKEGNAFDVMRAKDKKFNTSLVSDLYKEKEGSIDIKTDTICNKEDMGKSEYINNISGNNNVVDLYVTSSTAKGKKYGHRATMFRIGDQWFVIDPYTALQPGEQKNKPRTLESYALSMKTGKNKREFMRMDFYKSESLDNKVSGIFNSKNDLSALA